MSEIESGKRLFEFGFEIIGRKGVKMTRASDLILEFNEVFEVFLVGRSGNGDTTLGTSVEAITCSGGEVGDKGRLAGRKIKNEGVGGD